jgi:hypothetical protein
MENRCPNCGAINSVGASSCATCRRDLSLPSARNDERWPVQSPQQVEARPQREVDVAATPCPDRPIVWNASRIIYVVIALLATTYGVVLGVFWIYFLLTDGSVERDIPTNLLFASAPVMLIVAGLALYGWHADKNRRPRAVVAIIVAFTAVLLAAKAVLGMHWADAALQMGAKGQGEIGAMLLMVFLIVPNGVSALLLGLTAISLGVGLRK